MYSYEERVKAVRLYIKYDLSVADTIRELGYPSRNMLVRWHTEYEETGELHKEFKKEPKYSTEQMKKAVDYYLEHGRSISRTIRAIGYPSRPTLSQWIDELAPGERKVSITRGAMAQLSAVQKKDAVIALCTREGSAHVVAEEHDTSRTSLYKWKKQLLGEKGGKNMGEPDKQALPDDRDALVGELESLKKQVYRQQMELDILHKAAEILKKNQGIGPRQLSNKEKTSLIDALRAKYPLSELLAAVDLAKSSYFYQKEALSQPDKYVSLRTDIKAIFTANKRRYGYRRVHAVLKTKGITVSEKIVRKIMTEEQLVVPRKTRRKYNSYLGEISPAVENLVARDFHAEEPNTKWLTDLTEFHIPSGKIYLSPIIDCFDGLVVSWTIGTSPNAELVNTMLDDAVSCLADGECPIVHTDRGCHYRWPGWISRMESAGLTRSMSKKGCSPDNSACEGFFGTIKNEMFYYESWDGVSLAQFIRELDSYLRWYNETRIKMSLGATSPMAYRRSIGLVA
jgi:transposase InsO family protein/transposase-like protein